MSADCFAELPQDCKQRLCTLEREYKCGKATQKMYINQMLGELDDYLPQSIIDRLSEAKSFSKENKLSREELTQKILDLLSCYKPCEEDLIDDEVKENQSKMEVADDGNVKDEDELKGRTPSRAAKIKGQVSITSMFESMASKRKSSSEGGNVDKKMKADPFSDSAFSAQENLKRCPDCRQYLDEDLLKVKTIPNAREEFITLTLPELNIYDDDSTVQSDERVQHKITGFSVYGKCRHLCPFDDGLIEKNKDLYFCGYVKPIYSEEADVRGGLATVEMGPINEWFVHGFDGYFPVIGFSTAFAEYFLMEPSEEYAPYMRVVKEKTFISNLVISFALENEAASYEDLLQKLESVQLPKGLNIPLTEDTLIRHAQFVIDQVQSFDMSAESDEDLLISAPSIRALIKLAGVTLGTQLKKKLVKPAPKHDLGHASQTLATTTPLVTNIFNHMFKGEIDDSANAVRRRRCGQCEICLMPDCGKCYSCKSMTKFGGDGKAKQACLLRRCPNMEVQAADTNGEAEEEEDEMDKKALSVPDSKLKRKIRKKSDKVKVAFVGKPLQTIRNKEYYEKIAITDIELTIGDFVSVPNEDKPDVNDIGKIEYIWKDADGDGFLHVHWLTRGSDTVLGETSDPTELFLVDECDDLEAVSIESKVSVLYKAPSKDWFEIGGLEDGESPVPPDAKDTFFYQKWYDPELARFEDIPLVKSEDNKVKFCGSCIRIAESQKREAMRVGEEIDSSSNKKTLYATVSYQGYDYKVGSCCFLNPDSCSFKLKKSKKATAVDLTSMYDDDLKYPEIYRRSNSYVKGSNDDCPEPFIVARILEIFKTSASSNEVMLKIAKFYRPENTCMTDEEIYKTDLNLLYWSDEEVNVSLSTSNGVVEVVYLSKKDLGSRGAKDLTDSLFKKNAFYFSEAFKADDKEFSDPPQPAMQYKMKCVVEGDDKPVGFKKLRSLDVFAGCGGLSAGLHKCGIAETRWAIEKVETAAKAYAMNSKNTIVFSDDCNLLLKLAMEGATTNRQGQTLPQKGEVDLLCGGPPCQGFSGMNRFNSREYSRFKNSLIASYLSYCDYYRPKFFILENVRNFVSYKNSMVLKMALRCLVGMGYQCTFGVMQAGCYGVAQTRRRAIILAAAPGEKLPLFPEPTHVFAPKALQLTVVINDVKYLSNIKRLHSAPYRTITVRDCMSDLPDIKNGHKKSEMEYSVPASTHFQRLIRAGQEKLVDHVCKEMNPLVAARMSYIPTFPGSDWRLLPNIEVRLSDGTKTKLLKYTHKDQKNGKSSSGSLRGVCSCANGGKCDPEFRQFNTLIPWCLPHTGNRHNHWAGLYGRLEWDGFFSTTVTNPEPMGKQGRVLHPEQHRVVSVRECARSQGFPDSFVFHGTILDKHRQVGNAVPPPLGEALGQEIMKCTLKKLTESA